MDKLVRYNDLYIVTVSVVSNFIRREHAFGKIGTLTFGPIIGVHVVRGRAYVVMRFHCSYSHQQITNITESPDGKSTII